MERAAPTKASRIPPVPRATGSVRRAARRASRSRRSWAVSCGPAAIDGSIDRITELLALHLFNRAFGRDSPFLFTSGLGGGSQVPRQGTHVRAAPGFRDRGRALGQRAMRQDDGPPFPVGPGAKAQHLIEALASHDDGTGLGEKLRVALGLAVSGEPVDGAALVGDEAVETLRQVEAKARGDHAVTSGRRRKRRSVATLARRAFERNAGVEEGARSKRARPSARRGSRERSQSVSAPASSQAV